MSSENKSYTKTDCNHYILAIRDALEIFSGKWKIPIIAALNFQGASGFKELERMVHGITPKMLSKELKELEMNLLVSRKVMDTRPITVKYAITEYGKSCQSVIDELYNWGKQHRETIMKQKK